MRSRSTYLGGSDIAALVGQHPYQTALDVWCRKCGFADEPPINDQMQLGCIMQAGVADMFAERIYATIQASEVFASHPRFPNVGGTVDCLVTVDGVPAIVEIKTTWSYAAAQRWKHAAEGVVPVEHACQIAYYREIHGIDRAYLVGVVNGEVLIVEQHSTDAGRRLGEYLCETAQAWWDRYVIPRVPPEFDGSASGNLALAEMFKRGDGNIRPATADEWAAVDRFRVLRDARKAAQTAEQQAAQVLKQIIGDSDGISMGDAVASWKADVRGRRTLRISGDE